MVPPELLDRFSFFSFMSEEERNEIAKAAMEKLGMTRGQLVTQPVEAPKKLAV